MKKHILLGTALASLFALGACDYNEDNFPGFDEKETITDVSTDTLVLADAHYGKIASMPKNQGIALAKDPEGQTYLTALNQLGKTKMFTDMVAICLHLSIRSTHICQMVPRCWCSTISARSNLNISRR